MKKFILIISFFASILCQAQDVNNDYDILKSKIEELKKSGDTLSDSYPITLSKLAFLYWKKKEYKLAETLFIKVVEINKKNLEKNPFYYSVSCTNLGNIYYLQKKYVEAESSYLKAIKIEEKYSNSDLSNHKTVLNNLASLYREQKRYSESEIIFLKALELLKKNAQANTLEYAFISNNLAKLFEEQEKFSDAERYFLTSIEIEKEMLGSESPRYLESLNYLGKVYMLNQEYSKAKPLFLETTQVRKENLGENNLDYATSLHNLGSVYGYLGQYLEAESMLRDAMKIRQEFLGKNHEYYLRTLKNLAVIYSKQGRYLEAEPIFLDVLEINKNLFGVQHIHYLKSLYDLGDFYIAEGKYHKAEPLFLEIFENSENLLELNTSFYIDVLNKLGFVYRFQGRYRDAEEVFYLAFEIADHARGEELPTSTYFTSLNNLAVAYQDTGKYKEGETLFLKLIELHKKALGDKPLDYKYSLYLNNLGLLYDKQGEFSQAEQLYSQSLAIKNEILNENNLSYTISLKNLALNYRSQGKYSEAENLFLKSLKIKKEILGEEHPSYITNLLNLAILYRVMKSRDKEAEYFNKFLISNKNMIIDNVLTMSEKEIINFIKFKTFEFYSPLSFMNDLPIQYPALNLSSFENSLLLKNLSLRNQEIIKKSILNSGNKILQDKYQKYLYIKRELNRQRELPVDERNSNFEELNNKTILLEKELVEESVVFEDANKSISIKFNDIKSKLISKNEVLIDLVSFDYYTTTATDSTLYAVFLMRKDFNTPKFISLFEEKQLKQLLTRDVIQSDSTQINGLYTKNSISNLFLKPLEKELHGIKTIYLSPSGLGHQINFSALPVLDNETFGEKYNLHILSSPTEVVGYKVSKLEKKNNIELLLYGGIDFNKSEEVETTKSVSSNSVTHTDLITRSGIKNFGYLQGTNKEIEEIALSAKQNGFKTTPFTERIATEESIKKLDGRTQPFVLHLATHGFFFPDPEKDISQDMLGVEGKRKIYNTADDPMMRSGLLFAGANKFWGKPNDNQTTEDGILTASEISNLDLSACKLVVLSACETGLGEIQGSEGVFGLQRAFKMAGVKNIIMSLWKVPDAQTSELFDIFYEECFKGKSIHEAFKIAQSKIKAKYSPYYWAGFVLLE